MRCLHHRVNYVIPDLIRDLLERDRALAMTRSDVMRICFNLFHREMKRASKEIPAYAGMTVVE